MQAAPMFCGAGIVVSNGGSNDRKKADSMNSDTAGPSRKRKLSELVAEQLLEEIDARGWPVGESIGTESELMERYGVSRATLVEATRQVERHGAAVMRRGSGGGLFVVSSASAACVRVISTYLELSSVTITEQYEAARILEAEAATRAAVKIDEEQARQLREGAAEVAAAEDNVQMHSAAMKLRFAIADASGNKPLALFVRALARVLTSYVRPDLRSLYRDRRFEYSVAADMAAIVEAIVARDIALADHYTRADVERREQRARILAVNQPILADGPLRRETPSRLAEQVAFAIRDDIAALGWRAGERIANEAALPDKYGVSQWVLRQAIRVLELHGIVVMRRGQRGGLFIGQPAPEYAINAAVSFLRSGDVHRSSIFDLRGRLFENIAQLAAIRGSLTQRSALCAQFGNADLHPPSARAFLDATSAMSRNRVLGLFGQVLNEFAAHGGGDPVAGDCAEAYRAAAAIEAGDAPLARRRMAGYLDHEAA